MFKYDRVFSTILLVISHIQISLKPNSVIIYDDVTRKWDFLGLNVSSIKIVFQSWKQFCLLLDFYFDS